MAIRRSQKILLGSIFILISLIPSSVHAQVDTTLHFKSVIIIPSSLLAAGIVLNKNSIKTGIQENINKFIPNFNNRIDDYLMMAPTALDLILTLSDQKKNNTKHISDILIGEVIMYATTKSLKKIIASKRPNGGAQSFPSGHTSQAFTGASLFFHHYKKDNIWLASSGYILATATGAFRVLNNRHWVSDVFFGAGLGTLIGTLTYYLNPIGKERLQQNISLQMKGNGMAVSWTF